MQTTGKPFRAFDDTLLVISRRIDLLLALPIEKLSRLALEHRVKAIGNMGATEPIAPTT